MTFSRKLLLAPSFVFALYTGIMLIPHTIGEYDKPISDQQVCYGWRIAGEPGVIGATHQMMDTYCKSIHE